MPLPMCLLVLACYHRLLSYWLLGTNQYFSCMMWHYSELIQCYLIRSFCPTICVNTTKTLTIIRNTENVELKYYLIIWRTYLLPGFFDFTFLFAQATQRICIFGALGIFSIRSRRNRSGLNLIFGTAWPMCVHAVNENQGNNRSCYSINCFKNLAKISHPRTSFDPSIPTLHQKKHRC